MPALELPAEEFARLAEGVTAAAVEYLAGLDDRAVFPGTSGAASLQAFDQPAPEQGSGLAVVEGLRAVADQARAGNGRMFGYVMGSGEPVGALGDFFASVLNQNVTAWRSSPAAVTVERTVVGWLAGALGCAGFAGCLTGGGSLANLMGLAMAREAAAPANEHGAGPAVVYASAEVHMSVPKAVALLGMGRANLRLVPVDADFRMRADALQAAIAADRRAGRRAVAVVASAGTVNTGAVDPLPELSAVAADNGLWLHVDGAYGALAALAAPEKVPGLSLADSVSLDLHKWLYQPIDCGALLYRDRRVAGETFSYSGDYARTTGTDPVEGFAFFEESVELTRRFRALKVWLSVRYHGLGQFRAAIRDDLRHARLLAEMVRAQPALELLAPVQLSTVCFRWNDGAPATLDDRNRAILQEVIKRGRVYLSNATIGGRFALRACILNHRTTDSDIAAVVEEVLAAAQPAGPR